MLLSTSTEAKRKVLTAATLPASPSNATPVAPLKTGAMYAIAAPSSCPRPPFGIVRLVAPVQGRTETWSQLPSAWCTNCSANKTGYN